jgi:hypothetical protein
MEMDGIEVIGYTRKSVGDESSEKRTRLIQVMVDNLLIRSLVSKVAVAINSDALQLFTSQG